MAIIKYLFSPTKKPHRGLIAAEWAMVAYMVFTLLYIFFAWTSLSDPYTMLWGRAQILIMTAALWGVYRMIPCRFTYLCRISGLLLLLPWWYPDTFDLNRTLPNLDHVFASWEQTVMGGQPALTFAAQWSNPVFSEIMDISYLSYFPLIAVVVLFYFIFRYDELGRTTFIILASFFIFYTVYDLLPVTGPQYYYLAAGIDNISHGTFPSVGNYFATHQEQLTTPGWSDGFFYHLLKSTHMAGERPTAAFPSSHIGITTVLLLLARASGSRRLFFFVLPFLLLMCFSTVYIMAHYAIDIFAGLLTGTILYFLLRWTGRGITT